MENTNNKIITVSFMITGILIGIVINVLLEALIAVSTGGFGRFVAQDFIRHGVPVAVGFGVFLALEFNKAIFAWADEVVVEIRRVVWPSRKDTTAMTILVCVMVLISGIALGLLDVFSGTLIDWLLHLNFGGLFS
jgi:preprotein translocase subunit SecE